MFISYPGRTQKEDLEEEGSLEERTRGGGWRRGKNIFIKTSMAVFGLAGAGNGGFRQGGVDGGHFNST